MAEALGGSPANAMAEAPGTAPATDVSVVDGAENDPAPESPALGGIISTDEAAAAKARPRPRVASPRGATIDMTARDEALLNLEEMTRDCDGRIFNVCLLYTSQSPRDS